MGTLSQSLLGGHRDQPIPGAINDPTAVLLGGHEMPNPGMSEAPDPWTPHHRTTLGTLADALLSGLAGKQVTPFRDKVGENNLQEAMQGFASDPLHAIERMSHIKGREGDAWKLYEQYVDDKRQQGSLDRQNKLFDLKLEEIVRDRAAGILGTITPTMDPETRARVIQRAKTYASGKGFDDISNSIPDNADQIDIDSIRYGEIPVAKQEGLERSDRRLDQSDRRLDQGDTRLNETHAHNQATEGQAVTNEAGRNDRHNNPVARPLAPKPKPATVMTKYGVGSVNKDKTQLLLKKGSKYYLYLNGGTGSDGKTNWVPQGEVQPK